MNGNEMSVGKGDLRAGVPGNTRRVGGGGVAAVTERGVGLGPLAGRAGLHSRRTAREHGRVTCRDARGGGWSDPGTD
jgi:hypothetical protein